jgi:hypothetical protein
MTEWRLSSCWLSYSHFKQTTAAIDRGSSGAWPNTTRTDGAQLRRSRVKIAIAVVAPVRRVDDVGGGLDGDLPPPRDRKFADFLPLEGAGFELRASNCRRRAVARNVSIASISSAVNSRFNSRYAALIISRTMNTLIWPSRLEKTGTS